MTTTRRSYHVIDALAAPTDDLYVARVSALADITELGRVLGDQPHVR